MSYEENWFYTTKSGRLTITETFHDFQVTNNNTGETKGCSDMVNQYGPPSMDDELDGGFYDVGSILFYLALVNDIETNEAEWIEAYFQGPWGLDQYGDWVPELTFIPVPDLLTDGQITALENATWYEIEDQILVPQEVVLEMGLDCEDLYGLTGEPMLIDQILHRYSQEDGWYHA